MRTIATLNLPASTSGIWRFGAALRARAARTAPLPPLRSAGAAAGGVAAARTEREDRRSPTGTAAEPPRRHRSSSSPPAARATSAPRGDAPRTRGSDAIALGWAEPGPGSGRSGRKHSRRRRPTPAAAGSVAGRRATHSCTIGRDVRTNRAAVGAARHQRPAPRRAFGLHRGIRPRRLAPRDARRRPASPTSWSTSRSRGRPASPRPGRSPRRSRASAARSTRRPTASRRSTGSASRGARRRGRWTSSAS